MSWLCLLLLTAAPGAAAPPDAPGTVAGTGFGLVEVARQEGIALSEARITWNPATGQADVELHADTALWRLTPFLMMAVGPTQIDRMEVGRRVRFPVAARTPPPVATSPALPRLFEVLALPGLRERRITILPAGDDGPARVRLSGVGSLLGAQELYRRAEELLGAQNLTGLALVGPMAAATRVTLEGPWIPGADPAPEDAFVDVADWARARERAATLPARPVRLKVMETGTGTVVMSR